MELVTRVAVEELGPEEGFLREALSSLYSFFGTTREILRRCGPEAAKPEGKGKLSFALIAVTVLNHALRPLLAIWHPVLAQYESTRPADVSPLDHERTWPRGAELRSKLAQVRSTMRQYADSLAEVAGVPSLMVSGACLPRRPPPTGVAVVQGKARPSGWRASPWAPGLACYRP